MEGLDHSYCTAPMKHYVRVTEGGRTVTDAFIEADSPSDALKLALAGQGIDLKRIEPDRCYSITCGDVMTSSYGDEFERTGYSASMKDVPNAQGHLHSPPVVPRVRKLSKEVIDAIRSRGGPNQLGDFDFTPEGIDRAKAYITEQEAERLLGHAAEDIAKGEVGKVVIGYDPGIGDPHGQVITQEALDKLLESTPLDRDRMRETWEGTAGVSREELEEARRQIDQHYKFHTPQRERLREVLEKVNEEMGLTPSGRTPRPPNIPPYPHKKDMTRVRMYPYRDKNRELAEAFGAGPKMNYGGDSSNVVDVETWEIEQDYQSHTKTVRFTVHCPRCTTNVGMQLVVVGTISPVVRCRCNACGHIISARMPPYV